MMAMKMARITMMSAPRMTARNAAKAKPPENAAVSSTMPKACRPIVRKIPLSRTRVMVCQFCWEKRLLLAEITAARRRETTRPATTAATMATTSRPVSTARMRLGRLDSPASESDDEPLSSLSGSTRMAMCSLVTSTWLKTPIFVAVSASSGGGRPFSPRPGAIFTTPWPSA